jgi:hypothetical protein|tara:strand:+ start:407 stop:613 length:207 start_codon:yes stop_codon:yes gene_type:complete
MSSFAKIVRNYEQIYSLGKKIIKRKNLVRFVPPDKLDEEFKKQDRLMEEFGESIKKASLEWEKHQLIK